MSFTPLSGRTSGAAQSRILHIMEFVLARGPVSLADADAALDMPRTTIFRGLKALEAAGWITTSFCKSVFFASEEYARLMGASFVMPPLTPRMKEVVENLHASDKIHSDLFFLTGDGRIRLLNSTDKQADCGWKASLITEEGAIATLVTMSPYQRLEHVKIYLNSATKEERDILTQSGFSNTVKMAQETGCVWALDGTAISIPFRDVNNTLGALRLHTRRKNSREIAKLEAIVDNLRKMAVKDTHAEMGLFAVWNGGENG